MTALDLTTLESIASISFDDFKTNYDTHIGNSVASYYDALNGAATTAGLTNTANSATRAMDTANDYGVSGAFENEYAKEVAAGVSVDLSVGSDAWLRVQYDQMQADLSARTAAIGAGGTGELDPNTALAVISDSFVNVPGLTASASPLYVPLEQLSVTDPAAAQALLNSYYAPDSGSVTGGIEHLLNASVELGFGAVVSGDEGLSGVLGGWSNQAAWVGTMLTTASNLTTGGGITLPDDMAATLGNLAGIFSLAGGELGTLAKWTDGFLTTASTDPAHEIRSSFAACIAPWASAPLETSPLVIDLSSGHTGITLTTYNASTTTTFYDLDRTGFAEQTAWTTGSTGFLVQQNTDGSINLFGTSTVDGFAELAKLDSDQNLKIDSQDAEWSSLKIWIDANGNGIVDSGELHTLASENIASIDLSGVAPSTSVINGNPISHTSTVSFTDGSTATVGDAWFVHSTVNTLDATNYSLDDATLFLPDLRGYGTLPQLAVAMSQDSTLKGMVSDFADDFAATGFASVSSSDVASLLYQWAGVESVDPISRGLYVNAQQLEFLEHLFGQNFFQVNTQSANPESQAAADIDQSWSKVLEQFKDQLALQAGGSSLFANPVAYDAWTGAVTGTTSLSHTGIEALDTNAPSPGSDNLAYWVNVAHFLDTIAGLSSLTSTENGWLNDAVQASDSGLTWDEVKSAAASSHAGTIISGTAGDDTLTGTGNDDTINGNGGHDIVYTGDGNVTVNIGAASSTVYCGAGTDSVSCGDGGNTIYCGTGIDTVFAGGGNNFIHLGTYGAFVNTGGGNDTFYYQGGNSVIYTPGGTNEIVLPSGITSSDVTFSRVASDSTNFDDLLIQFSDGGTIQVHDAYLSPSYQVQTLEFSDSSTIDLTSLTNMTWVLNGGETVTVPSGSGDVDVKVLGGGNTLTLTNGTDTVEFGTGNNHVTGGSGNDTYIAGAGYNVITETAGTNVLDIPAGYTMDDITLSRVNGYYGPSDNLLVTIAGLGEVQINYQFTSSSYGIQSLHFLGDSSNVSLTSQLIDTIGTTSDDSLYGVTANNGGNWFDGRGGNDHFTGGTGDNTFNFSSGFGTDYVSVPYHTGNTNTIAFHGIDPSHIRMWTDTSGYLHLQDTTDTSHSIMVYAGLTGSGTEESAISNYIEQITFDDSAHTVWDLTSGLTLTAASGGDTLYGGPNNDTLIGSSGNDYLYGNGGNNTLISGGGDDRMYGGSGNNTFSFASGFGNSIVYPTASAGTNTIHLAGIDPADIHMWTDSNGYLNIQDTTDTSHTLTVHAGITGSGVSESTIGTYVQQVTFDSSYGTTWNLTGGLTQTGADGGAILYGSGHGDNLNGGSGADTIYCNAGNNTVYGAGGNDAIHCGAGADTIVFKGSTAETGVDTIYSWSTAHSDKIDIADVISTYDPLTMDIANFVQLSTSGSDTQVKVDTDGSGTSYTQIATLSGVTGLNLSDLITDGNLIVHHT